MKKALIYILSILSLGMISSCAQDDPIEVAKNNRIVFVAEPTPYEGDGLPTKADENYETISSLYLLLFDNTTKGIVGDPIDMISETEYAYIHEQESAPDMTAFFLANFTSEFVNSLTLSDLEDGGVLSVLVASEVVDNCIKPANDNAITGIPMIGKRSITQEDLGKIRTIPLKRLFAKVDVRVVMGTSDQSFDLESCTLTNLPQEVRISELSDTWVASGFNDPITLADDINTVTNEGYDLPTIYVPEHKPGISGTGQEQDKISASGNPLYLTLKGIYRRDANWSARVEYTIYLGGDNNTNFDLLRNHSYANVITINGVNSATTDKRVNYYGHNLADPTNSGAEDPANCYIISEPGRYMIPACKGNVLSETLTGDNSAVLANDNSSNSITNIQKVNFNDKDYIRFDVNLKNGTSTAVSDGNLVFQYGDWSWHLWFCENHGSEDDPFRPDDEDLLNTYGSYMVMDRALGATASVGYDVNIPSISGITDGGDISIKFWTDGLYYKNGSHNPFINGQYAGVESSGSWSSTKSVTDPCPPGYKVPSTGIWDSNINSGTMEKILSRITTEAFAYSIEVTTDFTKNILYPFSGYMYSTNNQSYSVNSGYQTDFYRRPKKDELGSYFTYCIEYDGYDYEKTGYLWANDGELFYARKGTTVTSSDVFIYLDYNSKWYPRDPGTGDGYDVEEGGKVIEKAIDAVLIDLYNKAGRLAKIAIKAIRTALPKLKVDEIVSNTLNSLTTLEFEYSKTTKPDTTPDDHGAQVRCVKE